MSGIASSIVAVRTVETPQLGAHDHAAIVLEDMAAVDVFRGFVLFAEYAKWN